MRRFVAMFLALGGLFLGVSVASSAEEATGPGVGDKAPTFEAKDDQGETWKSADHFGKKIVVVYFYPADCTGGCTKQAQGFRDDQEKLKEKGVEVIGVSGDSVENHKVFKNKEKLNFTLLADEDGKVAKAFGVPTKAGGEVQVAIDGKNVTLKRGNTAARWTFVIDQAGKIAAKNTSVKAAEDSKAILKTVEELSARKS